MDDDGSRPSIPSRDIPHEESKQEKKFIAEEWDEKAVLICKFCGGPSCPQEDFRTNKIQPNAIEGLHSNWITHNILAMQRPSERIIREYSIYSRFKKQNIKTILNLQEPGEHPYCGDGIMGRVGFSYYPEGFYRQGINFFNESWEDMTATTFEHMMRIMNIFYMSLRDNGKIAVHCHAGRGRTLLVICSWLIYNDRLTAEQTIQIAVERRQGVLTRSSQRQFLRDFQEELKKRWVCFGEHSYQNFTQFVEKQTISLLRHEQKEVQLKPLLHYKIITQLKRRLQSSKEEAIKIVEGFIGNHQLWNEKDDEILQSIKSEINNHTFFKATKQSGKKIEEIPSYILTELLGDFYEELPFILINFHVIDYLIEETGKQKKQKVQQLLQPEVIHESGVYSIAILIDLILFLKLLINSSLNLRNEGEDTEKCECLFIRFSILLNSKKKYHGKLFPSKRKSKLMSYSQSKREKYTNQHIIFLANYMRSLTKYANEAEQWTNSLILKLKNVDVNLYRKLSEFESEEGFFNKENASKFFKDSRLSSTQ